MTEHKVLTYDSFIDVMAARYVERGGFDVVNDECRHYCNCVVVGFLDSERVSFLDPAYDWTEAGARTLADEDLSYWDE